MKGRSHGHEVDEALALCRINVKPGGEAESASQLVAAPSRRIRRTGRRPFWAIGTHVGQQRIFFVAAARDQAGQIIAVPIISLIAAIEFNTILIGIFDLIVISVIAAAGFIVTAGDKARQTVQIVNAIDALDVVICIVVVAGSSEIELVGTLMLAVTSFIVGILGVIGAAVHKGGHAVPVVAAASFAVRAVAVCISGSVAAAVHVVRIIIFIIAGLHQGRHAVAGMTLVEVAVRAVAVRVARVIAAVVPISHSHALCAPASLLRITVLHKI